MQTHLNLEGARVAKSITIEEIARTTRIAPRFLEAIEAEDFGALPGGVYNTSYLRQYARAARFDESALIQYYYVRTAPVAAPEPPPSVFRVNDALRNFLHYVTSGRRSQHAA